MGKRPGLKYVALQRLDSLMAIGEKRSVAKAEARMRGDPLFPFTDGRIRSFETRENYQAIVMRFIDWCRDVHQVRAPDLFFARADELVSAYLAERVAANYSAWTLRTERSALRLFFGDRTLAAGVELPPRRRGNIKRSRHPAKHEKRFQPANWQPLITFCLATGLRREELRDLYVRDIYVRKNDEQLVVHVRRGKGGRARQVEVFPGREQAVLSVKEGRADTEKVFAKLPSAGVIHGYRRQFAQELYEYYAGRPLPPQAGRLQVKDVDREAAHKVSRQLGHNRIDVIFSAYIR